MAYGVLEYNGGQKFTVVMKVYRLDFERTID